MISTKEIANYYLQSLRQSSLVEVNAKYTKPFSTNYSEIVEGKILSPTFPDFFKRTRKGLAKTESSNGLSFHYADCDQNCEGLHLSFHYSSNVK